MTQQQDQQQQHLAFWQGLHLVANVRAQRKHWGIEVLSASLQEGDVQLWSVARGKLVESIPCATPVIRVASLPDDPFILLAEEGGGLQVAALINAHGEPALAASEPHSIALQPYQSERQNPGSFQVLNSAPICMWAGCQVQTCGALAPEISPIMSRAAIWNGPRSYVASAAWLTMCSTAPDP